MRAVESAFVTATMRALLAVQGPVRNPDYLAHHFAGPRWSRYLRVPRLFRRYVEWRIPGTCYYHLVRTLSFDESLRQALARGGHTQLVLLGAGYDTRAHRFAGSLAGVTTYEVDLPGTQAVKRARVAEVLGPPPNRVVYVPLDFQRDDLAGALASHGYDPQQRTIFLWEGVTYFLTRPAVERTLSFMRRSAPPGSVVVFDYALRSYVQGDLSYYGAKQLSRELSRVGEPHLFGLDANELRPFLGRFGFHVLSDLGAVDLEGLYLRGEDGRPAGKIHAFNRIACAIQVHSTSESPEGR